MTTGEKQLTGRMYGVFIKLGMPIETLPIAHVAMRLGLVVATYHPEWAQAYLKITEGGVPAETPSDIEAAKSFIELVPIETVS